MSTFPLPSAGLHRPVLPCPFSASPDGLGGWFVNSPNGRWGHAFPRVVEDPDGDWFGKLTGLTARAFPSEVEALAYVRGCHPDDITFEGADDAR